jgi:hypothetical protein
MPNAHGLLPSSKNWPLKLCPKILNNNNILKPPKKTRNQKQSKPYKLSRHIGGPIHTHLVAKVVWTSFVQCYLPFMNCYQMGHQTFAPKNHLSKSAPNTQHIAQVLSVRTRK